MPTPGGRAGVTGEARRAAAGDPWVGTLVGERYRLVERIGAGGMASVYRAEHELLKKPVAVKLLLPELSADKDMVARFEHEAIAAARLDHPNCVATTDFGKTPGGQLFLVMEFLAGTPLADVAGYGKRLPWERAVDLGRQILRGLARAHEMGIVHRDLKPSNIMLIAREGGRETAKIIDFGIAKIFDGADQAPRVETKAGIVFGTADFVAPERLLGKGDKDPRSDLYSVGVLLYEMVTGARPFHTDDPYEIVRRALAEAPVAPRAIVPELPADVDVAILRALEKDPERRFPSAREFLAALDPIGRRIGTGALVSPAPGASSSALAELADPFTAEAGAAAADPPPLELTPLPAPLGASAGSPPPVEQTRPWRGLSAVWVWAAILFIPITLITFMIVYSLAGGKKGSGTTPGFASLARSTSRPGSEAAAAGDREADIARLVETAGAGPTVEARGSAFDRLVALGYVDRVPWLAKLTRDLEQLPTCEERREVVSQLEKLNDPGAIPAIESARARADNECLRGAGGQAIAALGGPRAETPDAGIGAAEPAGAPSPDAGPAPATARTSKPARPPRRTGSGASRPSGGTTRQGGSGSGGGGHF